MQRNASDFVQLDEPELIFSLFNRIRLCEKLMHSISTTLLYNKQSCLLSFSITTTHDTPSIVDIYG